ncbi:MAG: 3-hydroxyacyl-ACP dehydratase FabZ [Bacteriovoracia bacterium]
MTKINFPIQADQIQSYLPHRFPFLLVDRVLDIQVTQESVGTKVVAVKNVTINEPYMQGHFPNFAIVPGVLLIETMAQATAFSLYPELVGAEGRSEKFQTILVGVNNARFRRPVVPGDSLRIESTVVKRRGNLWMFQVEITVEGQKVAEAEILANLIRNEKGESA